MRARNVSSSSSSNDAQSASTSSSRRSVTRLFNTRGAAEATGASAAAPGTLFWKRSVTRYNLTAALARDRSEGGAMKRHRLAVVVLVALVIALGEGSAGRG